MEYWHDMQTEKSWNILKEIKGKFPFILIGGWAVWMWTKAQKSKDIDIIVDFKTLSELKKGYDLRKNDKMRKYEIKIDDIDIDIYVTHYSQLAVAIEKIETTKIEGFDVARPEFLLALKQGAELERRESTKGEKDRIDIMGMLLKCGIDFGRYRMLLQQNRKEELFKRLITTVKRFDDGSYFGLNPRQLKLAKGHLLEKINAAGI